jgi:dihydrofolate reductase
MIDLEVEGDAWFPEWSAEEWLEVFREDHLADERNIHPYSFVRFERK